jgi:hypothetical protein
VVTSSGVLQGNIGGFWVLLQLGWGEDEASQPWIGEEAMAAATSLCDSDAMAGSLVVELRQEDSRRGKGLGGELAMKKEARERKNWATVALGAF